MVARWLATTALEPSWPSSDPILFLGEWCRLYERREQWSQLDAEVLPYHWDDRRKLEADYAWLKGVHESLLADLATTLNRVHGVEHSVRYWRIVLGPWLGFFVQATFDRWECVRLAAAHPDVTRAIVLTVDESAVVPRDMDDLVGLMVGDVWNQYICATFLRQYKNISLEICSVDSKEFGPRTPPIAPPPGGIARTIARRAGRLARYLARERDVFMTATYLPRRDELALYLRLGQVPQLLEPSPRIAAPLDPARRHWALDGQGNTPFERIIRELIPSQIPTAYLEGYRPLVERTRALPWPKRPRLIWTAGAQGSDETFKAWAAEKVEGGTPLVIGQHGGHFGVGRWCFQEDHDIAIADRYLSWGWTDPAHPNVVPVGQLKSRFPLGVDHGAQPDALLVTTGLPRYSYWLYAVPVAGQFLGYLDDQYRFYEGLPPAIRRQLLIRLHIGGLVVGWNQAQRMRDRLPDARFDDGARPLVDLVARSRLYISTYNATTFLESFTMNVPSVIFWNPEHWELRDAAQPFFDRLRAVGVFHDTPESAARHVAAIWDDVNGWWNRPDVREAVTAVVDRFAHLPQGLLDLVERELRGTISATASVGTARAR